MHEVVNPDDVGMRKFQAALCLTFKLVQQRSVLNHQVGKKFERDMTLQFFVACQPHNSHSAPTKHLDQPEPSKDFLSAASIQRSLEKATWADSIRRVGRDFASALFANFDCTLHGCFGGAERSEHSVTPEVSGGSIMLAM